MQQLALNLTGAELDARWVVRQFDEYSQLAHDGEKILVTREGKPWVLLTSPVVANEAKPDGKLEWPDFAARLGQHYPGSPAGLTATALLANDEVPPKEWTEGGGAAKRKLNTVIPACRAWELCVWETGMLAGSVLPSPMANIVSARKVRRAGRKFTPPSEHAIPPQNKVGK